MTNLKDMSPEALAAHMEYVNSGQAAADWEKAYQAARARANAVTEEEAAAREMQQVILDEAGTVRFRENVLVTNLLRRTRSGRGSADEPWMLEQMTRLMDEESGNAIVQWLAYWVRTTGNKPDMNEIAEAAPWPQKDEEQFAMLIGYSVAGAGDLDYFSDAMWNRANAEGEKLLEESKKA